MSDFRRTNFEEDPPIEEKPNGLNFSQYKEGDLITITATSNRVISHSHYKVRAVANGKLELKEVKDGPKS